MSRGALAILPSGSTPAGFACRNLSDATKAVPQVFKLLETESFSPTRRRFKYDVFLSFRGEDTRKGFVDYLRHRLVSAGISVFNDDGDLLSKQIGPGLSQAINDSKIAIPIISKNYGGSKWCLDELRQIMRCHTGQGQVVLPIFDGIDVSDVRELTGEFGKAFSALANHHTAEQVKEWEEALRFLAKIRGWSSREVVDGHQGQLVNMVVEKVLSVLSEGTSAS